MKTLSAIVAMTLVTLCAASFAKDAKPKTYTLIMEGAVCGGCATELTKAIESVEGAKVISAPKAGAGDSGITTAVVELSGKATLGKVSTAIEAAKTPHAEKVSPSVTGATTLKLKPGTTHDQVLDALKKAGLIEE